MRIQRNKFYTQIIVGAILVIISFLLSLFMVANIIGKSLLFSFLSYSFSLAGLTLGLLAIYNLISPKRSRKKRKAKAKK